MTRVSVCARVSVSVCARVCMYLTIYCIVGHNA